MEITSFDVSPDCMVTLSMSDMPKMGVRTSNTTVFIGGIPQGAPEEVSGQRQEIIFIASPSAEAGKITVNIVLPEGQGELTAASSEDYTPPTSVDPETGKPVVNSVSPNKVDTGGLVTLLGSRLRYVTAVRLGLFNQDVHRGVKTGDDSVMFLISRTTMPGDYKIFIENSNSGVFVNTNRSVVVTY